MVPLHRSKELDQNLKSLEFRQLKMYSSEPSETALTFIKWKVEALKGGELSGKEEEAASAGSPVVDVQWVKAV